MKKNYISFSIKGYHDHIKDLETNVPFDNFWELVSYCNYNYEVSDQEYLSILNDLELTHKAIIGDYIVSIDSDAPWQNFLNIQKWIKEAKLDFEFEEV